MKLIKSSNTKKKIKFLFNKMKQKQVCYTLPKPNTLYLVKNNRVGPKNRYK